MPFACDLHVHFARKDATDRPSESEHARRTKMHISYVKSDYSSTFNVNVVLLMLYLKYMKGE